jgi:MarR family transcriptional regulator, negative regulator of the multidrug operon emrRAB
MHVEGSDATENAQARDVNVIGAWALAVADAIREAAERVTGMAGGAPAALVAIVADPGISIDQLRNLLSLTHPGAVRLVDRLVDKGWVTRRPGTGRTVRLLPTPAGRRTERRLATARDHAVATMHEPLPQAQRHALASIIDPVLATATHDEADLRRLCRLCDRAGCTPCPVADSLTADETNSSDVP